jgi:hypothetical protein
MSIKPEHKKRTTPINLRLNNYEASAIEFGRVCSGHKNVSDYARAALMAYAATMTQRVATENK